MSEDLTQLILAEAVTALYNRFMTPYGQKQRLTAEQLHVIDEAYARARELSRTEPTTED